MPDNSDSPRAFHRILAAFLAVVIVSVWPSQRPAWLYALSPAGAHARVKAGIDALEELKFAPLRGKRIGLITNQTGVDASGRRTIDILFHAASGKLVAIFSPEHGIVGREDDRVQSTTDASTGLPVYSLYGDTRRPTPAMLNGLDALVFDIQDAGARFYTYTTTMGFAME